MRLLWFKAKNEILMKIIKRPLDSHAHNLVALVNVWLQFVNLGMMRDEKIPYSVAKAMEQKPYFYHHSPVKILDRYLANIGLRSMIYFSD